MKETLYLKIYEDLRENIINGAYKYGEKLPSKRTLAIEYGVSVITAEHSIDLLISEGYVRSKEKSGYFCAYKTGDVFLSSPEKGIDNHIHSSRHVSADFPFGIYAKTVRRVLSDFGEQLLLKCENGGADILRSEISRYLHRSRGIKVSKSQIIIGSGSEYLYGLIVDILGRDRIYAIESPSYEQIENVYRANGVFCEALPLGADGIKTEALSSSNADVLHITPYRSFPTGVTASPSKRLEYLNWAKEGERFIVEDDFESEFTITGKTAETVFSLSKGEKVIYLNTFSKSVSPAIRVAFMVLPDSLAADFQKKVGFYSCTVPVLEQYVMAYLLASGDFERHINRTRRNLKKENKNEK